jgi:hypothetical protein
MPRYSYNEVSQDCGLVTQPQNTDDDVTTIRGYAALPSKSLSPLSLTTMTVQTVNVSTLKRVKNNVIGNPSAKLVLAADELFVATCVCAARLCSPTWHYPFPWSAS